MPWYRWERGLDGVLSLCVGSKGADGDEGGGDDDDDDEMMACIS